MMRPFTALALAALTLACSPRKEESSAAGSAPDPAPPAGRVRLETSRGAVVIELDRDKAPLTVDNFLRYVDAGHFDGTVFHRVIDGFMIQGGGFFAEGSRLVEKRTNGPIRNEGRNGLKNRRGTIAMARTGDPDSATAQFFINLVDNVMLDHPNPDGHGYAVFGTVVEGMEVVDAIGKVATGTRPLAMVHPGTGQLNAQDAGDVPLEDILIRSARRVAAE